MALLQINGVVRLSSDIETKYTQGGTTIASFSIVSSSKYKTQAGEQREDTCFISATAFGRQAETLNQYIKKGSKLFVRGDLKLETWTDQQGQKKSKHSVTIKEFEFLDCKDNNTQQPQNSGYAQQQSQSAPTQQKAPETSIPDIDISDDEIPF